MRVYNPECLNQGPGHNWSYLLKILWGAKGCLLNRSVKHHLLPDQDAGMCSGIPVFHHSTSFQQLRVDKVF